MLRLALVAVVALVLVPSANAWSWPCDGTVLRPFSLVDDPYAAGQHRGIDVGCGAGAGVGAPASGTVTFAGSLPGMGRGVTIQTADGYAVTLVQLRATSASRGDVVVEGGAVGVVGESEDSVTRAPHVHLGVRVASDPNGYVDPLSLLPRRSAPPPSASAAPPPAVVAQPVAKPLVPVAPGAPPAPPAVQAPAAAEPAQPTVTPVAAESPQPAAAVTETPKPAEPVASAETKVALTSTTADEGSAPGLEVTAPASERSIRARSAAAGDVSPHRADASRGTVESRLTTPAVVDALEASSEGDAVARTGSAHALHVAPLQSRMVEPPVAGAPTQRLVAGEPREPLLRPATAGGAGRLVRWWLVASLVAAAGAVAIGAARIMTARVRVSVPAEDPGRAGLAVCERAAPHRACGGVRGTRGHLRALPPPAGQRRPHGVRDRRAWDAGDGDCGQGRALAA
jgi:hypothetical protein